MTPTTAVLDVDSSGVRIETVPPPLNWMEMPLNRQIVISVSGSGVPMTRYLADRFMANLKSWRDETLFSSTYEEIVSHPAYHRIAALGSGAIPLIIEDMRSGGGFWTEALTRITGVDPVPAEAQGDNQRIADSWETWYSTQQR
ncbi:MAG: hypothetical protein PHU43_04480 [Candidatus Bipolaricaulis sp.]|nr:hypothetical protein [Candidatus Bipolaricaulis sp.]